MRGVLWLWGCCSGINCCESVVGVFALAFGVDGKHRRWVEQNAWWLRLPGKAFGYWGVLKVGACFQLTQESGVRSLKRDNDTTYY